MLYSLQAFLHYSLKASKEQFLICNIQGVGHSFAGPRIHTLDGKGFGQENEGEEGVKNFSRLHVCNRVCRYLALDQDDESISGCTSGSSSHFGSPTAAPTPVSSEGGSRDESPTSPDRSDRLAEDPRPASSSPSRRGASRFRPRKSEGGPEKIAAILRSKSEGDNAIAEGCKVDPDRDAGRLKSGQAAEPSTSRASSLWKAGAANALQQSKTAKQYDSKTCLEGLDEALPKRVASTVSSVGSQGSGSSRERELQGTNTRFPAALPSRASSLWKVGITGAMSSLYSTFKGENRSIRERVEP